MKTVSLNNHPVRVDDDGFICLTDLWKASGRKNKHRPKYFLDNEKTIEFTNILNVKGGIPPLRIVKGGKSPGTFVHKLLAYEYSGWVDPEFKYSALTVLDNYFSGHLRIGHNEQRCQEMLIKITVSENKGTFHGKGLNKRKQEKKELHDEAEQLLKEVQPDMLEALVIRED